MLLYMILEMLLAAPDERYQFVLQCLMALLCEVLPACTNSIKVLTTCSWQQLEGM